MAVVCGGGLGLAADATVPSPKLWLQVGPTVVQPGLPVVETTTVDSSACACVCVGLMCVQVEWKLPSNTATTSIPILTFSFLPDTSSDLVFPAMALNW